MEELDFRDIDFWIREARRKELFKKMYDLRMSRMGWAENDAVRSEMAFYESALKRLEGNAVAPNPVKSWLDITGGKRRG